MKQPEVFYARCFDSANGAVRRVTRDVNYVARLEAALRQGSDAARDMLLKMHATDEAATTNQLANAGNVRGLNAGTVGVSATVKGVNGKHDGKVQDSDINPESLRNAIAVVEQILAAVKRVAANRANGNTTATGASTEDNQGWGLEGGESANATGESHDVDAPSLQNPNNAIAQRLDNETEKGMDANEATLKEAANMLEKMGAQDSAFEVRSQRHRSNVLCGLQSRGAIYAAGVRSAMDVKPGASQDAAEAAMRAAGFDFGKRGHLTMIG